MPVAQFVDEYSRMIASERALLEASVAAAYPDDVSEVVGRDQYLSSSPLEVFDIEGCDVGEVEEVRGLWGGWLPESVEAFLLLCGRRSRFVDLGFVFVYPYLLNAADSFDEWLEEMSRLRPEWYGDGERFRVPEGAFHLGHHQGYQFFFVVDRVADPVVHLLFEAAGEGSGVSSTGLRFSELVMGSGLLTPRRIVERSLAGVVRRRERRSL